MLLELILHPPRCSPLLEGVCRSRTEGLPGFAPQLSPVGVLVTGQGAQRQIKGFPGAAVGFSVFSAMCSGTARCCPRSCLACQPGCEGGGGAVRGGDRGESRRGRRKWERKGLSGSAAMHAGPGRPGGPSGAGREGVLACPPILLHPGWVHRGFVSPGEGKMCRSLCSILGARAAPGITPAAGSAGRGAVWGSLWGRGSPPLSPSPPATQPTWAARPLCPRLPAPPQVFREMLLPYKSHLLKFPALHRVPVTSSCRDKRGAVNSDCCPPGPLEHR